MKTIKKAAAVSLVSLAALLSALCLYTTFTRGGENMLPGFLSVQAYDVASSPMDCLPEGSAGFVLPSSGLERGHVAAYRGEFFIFKDSDGQNALLYDGEKDINVPLSEISGRVVYTIEKLGFISRLIRSNVVLSRAVFCFPFLGIILWLAFLPRRRRKAEVRELIALFEYYGNKYDAEDADIDY